MSCKDSKMKENTDNPNLITEDGQLVPLFNLMKPTEIPGLIDNGNGAAGDHAGGDHAGGDRVLTTYVTITKEPETGGHYHQPTVTITTAMEKVTVTVTMTPSTLSTLPTWGTHVQTVTTTTTAAPLGRVCTTTGTAVGVPLACIFGTGFIMFGLYTWFWRKKNRSEKRRREAAAAALGYSDGSSDDPTAPLACPRLRGGDSSDGGPHPGIVAPPSSLASQPAGPFADPTPRYGRGPARTVPQGLVDDSQNIPSQRASFVSGYSGTVPRSRPSIEGLENSLGNGFTTRRNSIAAVLTDTANANGEIHRAEHVHVPMDDGEVVTFENGPAGRTRFPNQLRTVVYVPPTNGSDDVGPVIRPVQTAPLRPIEVIGRAHASQRASIVEVVEDQESDIPPTSSIPDYQERADTAELEGSPVPRRYSAADSAKGEGRASKGSDDTESQTFGKDALFELSADNPIHELSTEGVIPASAKAGQKEDNKYGDEDDNS